MNRAQGSTVERPPVSVLVPFLGTAADASAMLRSLSRIALRPGDEIIVADNSPQAVVPESPAVQVVRAPERRSAYHARNIAAASARAEWLLFVDADCEPPADVIDRLLIPPPQPGCAIVAAEVVGDERQAALAARWARSRRGLIVSHHLHGEPGPAGSTASLLVAREAFEAEGGFVADVRSDADIDLCWRIQRSGGGFEYRGDVRTIHRDPETIRHVVRQARGYGAGRRWLRTRWPTAEPIEPARALIRALGGAGASAIRGRLEAARLYLLDAVNAAALWWGYRRDSNRAG